MSWISNFINGGKNPADAAIPYFNQIGDMSKQYLNPFIQQGQQAYQGLKNPYDQMSQDPAGFLESLMGKYQPSKSYQLKNEEALKAAGNSAAAGGMRGSMQDIQNEAHLSDSLLGEDMQQWLKNVLGLQKQGLEGQQNLYNTGFDASKSLQGDLSNLLGTQGQLAFQGQRDKNQSKSDLLRSLMGLGGSALGWL